MTTSRRARAGMMAALALAAGTCLPSVGMPVIQSSKTNTKPRKYVNTLNTKEMNDFNREIELKKLAKKQMKLRKFAFDSKV